MANSEPQRRCRIITPSGRVEAFSAAVFAITITLLVLELHRPQIGNEALASALLHEWPAYFAFVVSFVYIGVIWLNHHALFASIRKVGLGLSWINLGSSEPPRCSPFRPQSSPPRSARDRTSRRPSSSTRG